MNQQPQRANNATMSTVPSCESFPCLPSDWSTFRVSLLKHSITCGFCVLCALFKGPTCQPWRMGSDLGLHGFLRSLPGTDPRNWCVCWRLWIQGVDRFWPSWENQEAQCWNRQRKTCDDGYHRHVFPGGDRVLCAYCSLQLSKTRNTAKIVTERAPSAPERITSQCQCAWRVLSLWS